MVQSARVVDHTSPKPALGPGPSALSDADIVGHVACQHAQVRLLLHEVLVSAGPQRAQTLDKLRVLLATHTIAAESVIRPALTQMTHRSWEQDRREEDQIRDRLHQLHQVDPASAQFQTGFSELAQPAGIIYSMKKRNISR